MSAFGLEELQKRLASTSSDPSCSMATALLVLNPKDTALLHGCYSLGNDGSERELASLAQDMAVHVTSIFDEIHSDSLSAPSIPSPFGLDELGSNFASGSSSKASSAHAGKVKIRTSARAQKLLGDLHLLTGSFSEAVACFATAAEDSRGAGDSLWNAAAQEGFYIAHTLQQTVMLAVYYYFAYPIFW
jgi:hypothetical protein